MNDQPRCTIMRSASPWIIAVILALGVQASAPPLHAVLPEPTNPNPIGTIKLLFVALDGDDANPGTLAEPLATLHGARDRIRAIKAETGLPEGGLTVYLRGGEYVLEEPEGGGLEQRLGARPLMGYQGTIASAFFKLSEEDSGAETAPILYRAYQDEKVALSRGDGIYFQLSLIENQAKHVFFEGIEIKDPWAERLRRKRERRIEPAEGEPLRIVVDGRPNAMVVVSNRTRYVPGGAPAPNAAHELVRHVQEATGVELPLFFEPQVPEDAAYAHRIYVGATEAAAAQGIRHEDLLPEAFVLRTVNGDLYVVGRDETEYIDSGGKVHRGTLSHDNPWYGAMHGVYELLRRSLGVRWVWPGNLGAYVPRTDEVVIAPVNEYVEPALLQRAWWGWWSSGDGGDYGPTAYFLRRHGNFSFYPGLVGGHSAHAWWKAKGREHPEWFAMNREGERGEGPDVRRFSDLCVSNRELQSYVANEAWRGDERLGVGEADSGAPCHCPECEAMDAPHPEGLDLRAIGLSYDRVMGDRYATFWQNIYGMAVKRNPAVRATTLLYHQTLHPPLGKIELSDRIIGAFCHWNGSYRWFPMPDDHFDRLKKMWQGWRETGMSMTYRPNYFHGGYAQPFLSTRQAGEFLKFAYEHGNMGWMGDSYAGHWSVTGPMLYVHMRLMWDPELEIDDIRSEFFSAFGPAAGEVERYFDYWEERSHRIVAGGETSPGMLAGHYAEMPSVFPLDAFAPAERMLDEALEAARRSPLTEYAERVEFLRLGLEHARLQVKFCALLDPESDARGGRVVIDDRARFEATRGAWREMQDLREKAGPQLPFVDVSYMAGSWANERVCIEDLDALDQEFDEVFWRTQEQTNPWSEWRFRKDPDNRGMDEGWQSVEFDEGAWEPIEAPAFWVRTWVGDYLGYGWYRTTFRVPPGWAGSEIHLHFGGVDEQAWVFVNGTPVGEHTVQSEGKPVGELWDRPFTVKAPGEVLKPGEENVLVVRVHASVGNAGIHRPVVGHAPHPEQWRPLPER